MNDWIEERSEALRLALGIGGFPDELDVWRLFDLLSGCVILRYADVETARCQYRDDGRSVVTLPERQIGRRLDERAVHEIGHALLSMGMGSLLRQLSPGDRRAEFLARRWGAQDEARAREFVLAWYLPSALVVGYGGDTAGLAEASNCDLGMIRRRQETLDGEVFELRTPPRWSAHWTYHAVYQAAPAPMLYVARRGEVRPLWIFPVSDRDGESAAHQLVADLVALTAAEFEGKYAPFGCDRAESVPVEISVLRERICRAAYSRAVR